MKERIEKILSVASPQDAHDLKLAIKIHDQAGIEARDEQSAGAIKKMRSAYNELCATIDAFERKYSIAEERPADSFRNKKAVLDYLKTEGWQISQSQFYAHCKERYLRPDKEGKYTLKAVEKYAKTWLKLAATGEKINTEYDRKMERKLDAEIKAAEVRADREQFELETKRGRFIPRDEFELAIVGRAVAFMAHLNHTVQTNAAEWIEIVGGDQTRAPELVQAISRAIEQRMGDFAADAEFDVIMEAN